MNRIIDANLNRATEALRVLEEIARFYLNNKELSARLKNIRHKIAVVIDDNYADFLKSRDTEGDIGVKIANPSERTDLFNIYKANFKRLQQALRVLGEYSQAENLPFQTFEQARYESYTLEKEMFEELSTKLNKYRLQDKKLYLVTDSSKFESDDAFLDAVASSLAGGVQIVQLREKNASAKRFVELAWKIKELCSLYDAILTTELILPIL